MNVTKRLLRLDPTLELHNEGEWGGTELEYSAFNDGGVECEVGEFLYAMVRLLKPTNVLETGTHHFMGGAYLGLGLKDNGFGELDTLEFLPEVKKIADKRIAALYLGRIVRAHLMDAALFKPTCEYQLILLDTEPQTRFKELEKFYPHLAKGGYLLIHDLHRHMHQIPNEEHGFAWPFGIIPPRMMKLVADGRLRPFHFPTPRGLTGFYKVADEDFKWES